MTRKLFFLFSLPNVFLTLKTLKNCFLLLFLKTRFWKQKTETVTQHNLFIWMLLHIQFFLWFLSFDCCILCLFSTASCHLITAFYARPNWFLSILMKMLIHYRWQVFYGYVWRIFHSQEAFYNLDCYMCLFIFWFRYCLTWIGCEGRWVMRHN